MERGRGKDVEVRGGNMWVDGDEWVWNEEREVRRKKEVRRRKGSSRGVGKGKGGGTVDRSRGEIEGKKRRQEEMRERVGG